MESAASVVFEDGAPLNDDIPFSDDIAFGRRWMMLRFGRLYYFVSLVGSTFTGAGLCCIPAPNGASLSGMSAPSGNTFPTNW